MPVRFGSPAELRRWLDGQDSNAKAAVLVKAQDRARRGRLDVAVTEREPPPKLAVSMDLAMAAAVAAATRTFERIHPLASVWRTVATGARLVPIGGPKTGRYKYVVEGYVRTTLTRSAFRAEVDATTAAVVGIRFPDDGA